MCNCKRKRDHIVYPHASRAGRIFFATTISEAISPPDKGIGLCRTGHDFVIRGMTDRPKSNYLLPTTPDSAGPVEFNRLVTRRAIKVLHIEDDPSVARAMARVLRLKGCEVFSAATRDEAMHHVGSDGLRPDLILTDFQLGERFTSEGIVAEIAARLQFKPPTILLTGTAGQPVDKAKAFADRILPKPIDIDVLLREIESLLGTRL